MYIYVSPNVVRSSPQLVVSCLSWFGVAHDVKALVHHIGIATVGVRIQAAAKWKKVPQLSGRI